MKPRSSGGWMERYRRRKAGSPMRRRKETHAAEARARSVGEATRRKISSWRSLVRAGGGRSGSVASRQGRIRPALDAIAGEGRKGIEGLGAWSWTEWKIWGSLNHLNFKILIEDLGSMMH